METARKTFKEKLRPTPKQERALEVVLWRCRTLYRVWLHTVDPGCAVGLQQGKIVLPTSVIDRGPVKRRVVGEDLLARDVCDQFRVDL